jgi:hypothetical protein
LRTDNDAAAIEPVPHQRESGTRSFVPTIGSGALALRNAKPSIDTVYSPEAALFRMHETAG